MTTNNNHISSDDSERVLPGYQCPHCGEDDMDYLVWIDDDRVRCATCGTIYNPDQPDAQA
ncbi:MAG: hypothetical protein KatS3mg109_0423 [Pirellulaceae bacterium]|nr:MAG: hypothetical protein KatS3mg109_0423 [Pirellulaceae bacterium]